MASIPAVGDVRKAPDIQRAALRYNATKKNKISQKFCKSVLQIKLRGNLVRQLSEII